jgi:hypothetical protein
MTGEVAIDEIASAQGRQLRHHDRPASLFVNYGARAIPQHP